MGNRAVITTEKRDLGVYVHWNGGRDSVEGFLAYCKLRGFRSPESDCYGWARLCQVIGNYFGGDGLSVGIQRYTTDERMDPGDNGIYIIRNWEIVDRVLPYDGFREQCVYPLDEMLGDIDQSQPKDQQIGGFIAAQEIPVDELQLGDWVYLDEIGGVPKPWEVIGFGTKDAVNGRGYLGKPYCNKYTNNDPEMNPNNYPHVFGKTCRIAPRKTVDELQAGAGEVLTLFSGEEN